MARSSDKAAYWAGIIRRYRRSGLTQPQFCRENDISYSRFVAGLKAAEIEVDRKILADLAVRDSAAFGALVSTAREALEAAA